MRAKPSTKKVKRKLGEVMSPEDRARFPRLADLPTGPAAAFDFLSLKLQAADADPAHSTATALVQYEKDLYLASMGSGPKARQAKAAEQMNGATDWRAEAVRRWEEARTEGKRLSDVEEMAKDIRDGLKGKDKPSVTMIRKAIQGLKPKLSGAKRKPSKKRG